MARSETVTIRCSLALARWLGADTCGQHELSERGFIAYKNFRVFPTDGPNYMVYWKWPVVQPGDGTEFYYP